MRVTMMFVALAVAAPAAAGQHPGAGPMLTMLDEAQGRGGRGPQTPPADVPWNDAIPPGTAEHAARALTESSRHQEWVDIELPEGGVLNSFVVYPERPDDAAVVLVIHDIRGMSDLARALGDQLAQDGYIAIVPDFLSGMGPDGGGSASLGGDVGQAIRTLTPDMVNARLDAAMRYGQNLPSSNGKTGVVGFCWGGARSFGYAAAQADLDAAVVFYGDAPGSADGTQETALDGVGAPVLGLYAGNDNRINSTVPGTEAAMTALGKSYDVHTFEGAGHGFVFSQAGAGGANLRATADAWPLVLEFYEEHLR